VLDRYNRVHYSRVWLYSWRRCKIGPLSHICCHTYVVTHMLSHICCHTHTYIKSYSGRHFRPVILSFESFITQKSQNNGFIQIDLEANPTKLFFRINACFFRYLAWSLNIFNMLKTIKPNIEDWKTRKI